MFKGISGIASLMQLTQQLPEKMEEMEQRLKSERISGNSGGGMVTVEVDGTGEVKAVRIEKELFDQHDQELIEDLIPAAVNNANAKAKERAAELMKDMAAGMNFPGIESLLSKFGGGAN